MNTIYSRVSPDQVKLLPSIWKKRFDINLEYLLKYQSKNLLQNYYFEAGLWRNTGDSSKVIHWGWEAPTSEIRGHYLGHWLSAAALSYAQSGNNEILGRASFIVKELIRCQESNGGEWIGAIPIKYLEWAKNGRNFGVPLYNLHKLLMGLNDIYEYAGLDEAKDVATHFADWFCKWTKDMSESDMDQLMEIETGGILEEWVRLYNFTEDEKYLDLARKFIRRPLLKGLLEGNDILSNMHANTTIPEVLGFARLYMTTDDPVYLQAVKNYWNLVIENMESFVTGGQTSGEIWIPSSCLHERIGKLTQEHCTVYNMIRLADFLFLATGESKYADYREKNTYNGILAQQNPITGATAYYLPLETGSVKKWSTLTDSFWCCCGTVAQAGASHGIGIYAENEGCVVINQYIPSILTSSRYGRNVSVTQNRIKYESNVQRLIDKNSGDIHHPDSMMIEIAVETDRDIRINIRNPFWNLEAPDLWINGEILKPEEQEGYLIVKCPAGKTTIILSFKIALTVHPMPGCQDRIAFMEGPVVLAGLTESDYLIGPFEESNQLLSRSNERIWGSWTTEYRGKGQHGTIRFIPLYEITDETYTVYFYQNP